MAFRLNRLNDYFFKWLFGREERKDILLSFLNAVLSLEEQAELIDITVAERELDPEGLPQPAVQVVGRHQREVR